MNKILNLSGAVNEDLLLDLIDFVNGFEDNNDTYTIYLSGQGGDPTIGYAIVDILNTYKDKIEVVGYSALISSTLRIFLLCKNKKRIQPITYGVHHLTTITMEMNDNGELKDRHNRDVAKAIKEDHLEPMNEIHNIIGITDKEKAFLEDGEDLIIGYTRLNNIISKQNKENAK